MLRVRSRPRAFMDVNVCVCVCVCVCMSVSMGASEGVNVGVNVDASVEGVSMNVCAWDHGHAHMVVMA